MSFPKEHSLRVLIVDDDPVDRQLVEQAFSDVAEGVDVHLCDSAQDALRFLRQEAPYQAASLPDACIFDINMPKTSGLELLEQVKADAVLRKLLVVIMSSSDAKEDVDASYDLQASCYIQKPENYGELRKLVGTLTSFWEETVSFPSKIKRTHLP